MLWRPPARFDSIALRASLVDETLSYLRQFGHVENIAYWSGVEREHDLIVRRLIKPVAVRKRAFVRVHGDEVAKVVMDCHEHQEFLIAQLHTHPGIEDHSETDDCGTVSKRNGFVSIVVPFYARYSSIIRPGWFGYQLQDAIWFPFDMGRIRYE